MTSDKKNLAASVRQRLYNAAKANGEDFNLLLVRYANERWLYRLSISSYQDRFYLKGASRLNLWFDKPHRPTRDIDLLGFGSREIADLKTIIVEICNIDFEDGMEFRTDGVTVEKIREATAYGGLRAKFLAFLGTARISVQVDIGFGDAVTPKAETITVPALLEFPEPKLLGYPKETVVAEKFEAMVKLGIANSRMKDFWDLNLLIGSFEFEGSILQEALIATFESRQTPFPIEPPFALTEEFARDKSKQTQWSSFLRTTGLIDSAELKEITDFLAVFFLPLIMAGKDEKKFNGVWDLKKWVVFAE
jgi:hypothetical protein